MIPRLPPLIPINTVDHTQNYDQVKIDLPLNNQMLVKTKQHEKEKTHEYKKILWQQEDPYLSPCIPVETKYGYNETFYHYKPKLHQLGQFNRHQGALT